MDALYAGASPEKVIVKLLHPNLMLRRRPGRHWALRRPAILARDWDRVLVHPARQAYDVV